MPLPTSGPISAAQINAELGRASNAPISLGDPAVRQLAGIATGPIGFGNLLGKSNGGILVAGLMQMAEPTDYFVGYNAVTGMGSLTTIPGMPSGVETFLDQIQSPYILAGGITINGDVRAALAGKSIEINGTTMAMRTATFASGKTSWQRAQFDTRFGFVNGQTYTIRVV